MTLHLTRNLAVAAALAVLLPACSEGDGKDDSLVSFELEVDLAVGDEVERCKFVSMPAEEVFVLGGKHLYTPGSHHMLLFRTDLTEIPADHTGVQDCRAPGKKFTSHVRGLVYGAQVATGESHYPEGVGLPLKPSEILLLQAHYINATETPLKAKVSVDLFRGAPESVQVRAGTFFFYDPFIHVPANSTAKASMSCAVRGDVTLLSSSSHMHRRGVGYRAFLDTPTAPATEPFYVTDSWDHPEVKQGMTPIAKDSVIRFECDYMNTGANALFQGGSAVTNEMCMFIGVYYPALSTQDEFCMSGPHNFGTGSKTCGETTTCVQKCPAGTAPMLSTNAFGQVFDVHECWQECFASSCPKAWKPMMDQFSCIRGKCGAECMMSGSSECQNCVASNCLDQYFACGGMTCD